MVFEDVLKKHDKFDAVEGSGFIFLMPITDDEFDHTMYKVSEDFEKCEPYGLMQFSIDGYWDDKNVKPVPFEDVLARYRNSRK